MFLIFLAVCGLAVLVMYQLFIKDFEKDFEKAIDQIKREPVTNNMPQNPATGQIEGRKGVSSPITETKPKVQAPEKPLGAIYKFNTLSGSPYGSWKDAKTGEQRFYDKDGKFYTNTQEILDAQKPKAKTATST